MNMYEYIKKLVILLIMNHTPSNYMSVLLLSDVLFFAHGKQNFHWDVTKDRK